MNLLNNYILPLENINSLAAIVSTMDSEFIIDFINNYKEQIPKDLYNLLILSLDDHEYQKEYLEQILNMNYQELISYMFNYSNTLDNDLDKLTDFISKILKIITKQNIDNQVKYITLFRNNTLTFLNKELKNKIFFTNIWPIYLEELQQILSNLSDDKIDKIHDTTNLFEVNYDNLDYPNTDEEFYNNQDRVNHYLNRKEEIIFLLSYRNDEIKLSIVKDVFDYLTSEEQDMLYLSLNNKQFLEKFIIEKLEQLKKILQKEYKIDELDYILRIIAEACKKIGDDKLTEKLLDNCYNINPLIVSWFIIAIKNDLKKLELIDKYSNILAVVPNTFFLLLVTINDKEIFEKCYQEYDVYLSDEENIELAIIKKNTSIAVNSINKKFAEILKQKQALLSDVYKMTSLLTVLDYDEQLEKFNQITSILPDCTAVFLTALTNNNQYIKLDYVNSVLLRYKLEIRKYSKNRKNFN